MPRKYKIFLLLICLLLSIINVNSQSIKDITRFGDSLFLLKENFAARNEYERAFFFSSNPDKKLELSKKIAGCYLAVNKLSLAYAYYDTALYYTVCDSGKIASELDKILCIILEKDFRYALLKLDKLDGSGSNEYLNFRINFVKGICNFGLEKYDEAYSCFYNSLNPNDSLQKKQLNQLFDRSKALMRPYPNVATTMSIFVPGSGQVYAGEFKNGINSLVLLSTLSYIALFTPVNFIIILPFFYRYYSGGILNANKFAKKRKREKQYSCYIDLMKIFKENGYLEPLFNLYTREEHYDKYLKNSVSETDVLFSISFLFYKKYISSQDIDACIFTPSCSVYMIESTQKKGLFFGFLDGADRLLRCHPFANEHEYQYNEITKKYYDPL